MAQGRRPGVSSAETFTSCSSTAMTRSMTPQPFPVHCRQALSTQRLAKRNRRSGDRPAAAVLTKLSSMTSGVRSGATRPSRSTIPSSVAPGSHRALGQLSASPAVDAADGALDTGGRPLLPHEAADPLLHVVELVADVGAELAQDDAPPFARKPDHVFAAYVDGRELLQ